ncbi:hypothetical protein CAPTEDRAFT_152611 [Capitella teleta]|uniref:SHSP domain-containing protein n=1 Tax=Capitella teleta TaxID=283909 RepID=R7VBH6_CAPTE|nr:hypothetical protein CAPTEDRAFT_152611 [Capitella teleta]|eukprot:ELU15989.1 hypothetical protein CAPTEDRAFT_152611 [Capitella teleta]
MSSDELVSTAFEKDVPVQRMTGGFFDPFFLGGDSSSDSTSDFGSSMMRMKRQMADMERQMERMFEQFARLEPISARSTRSATGRYPSWWDDDGHDASLLGWRRGPRGVWEGDLALPAATSVSPMSPHEEPSRLMLRQSSHDHQDAVAMPKPAGGVAREFGAPVVVDHAGARKLRMRFDVRQFKPEEIQVKTHDNKVMVKAVHKEESDTNQVFCEYQRMFTMPPEVKPDTLTSALSPDGVLTLEAPMPCAIEEVPQETHIPITHE